MSVRKKIGLVSLALLVVLAAFVVSVPYLINLNAYKPALVEAVKAATGRELVIEGPLKLTFFPEPRISARKVHFANAVGGTGAQMLDVRWIGATPSWRALLRGRIEVGNLVLYKPSIVLETDADGVPNWEFKPGGGAAQPAGAPAAGLHLAIGSMKIVQGTISYTYPKTGKSIKAEQVEATASVSSFDGPFTIAGQATVNGVPLSLDLKVSEMRPGGHDTVFTLHTPRGNLDYAGKASKIAPDADLKGHLAISTDGLTDFIIGILNALGERTPDIDSSVVGRFTFDGDIEIAPTKLALADFKMSLGHETASGSLTFEQGASPSVKGNVSLPKLKVDRWLALLATPGAFAPAAPPAPSVTPAAPAPAAPASPAPPAKPAPQQAAAPPAAKPPAPTSFSPFPVEVDVSVGLEAAEVVYGNGTVHDLAVAVEIHRGVITIPKLRARLPGDMVIEANTAPAVAAPATKPVATKPPATKPPASPAAPASAPAPANPVQTTGDFSLAGPNLRATLAWLEIDTSGVPADRLREVDLKGKVATTGNGVQLSDVTLKLDDLQATGSGGLSLADPLTTTLAVQIDRLDLDSYMPPKAMAVAAVPSQPVAKPGAPPAATSAPFAVPAAPPAPDKAAPVFALKLKLGKLVFRRQTLNGIESDLSVKGNLLQVNALKVADLLGGKLDAKGAVANFGTTTPRYDVSFNGSAPDADKLIDYVGLPKLINGKIGAAAASGAIVGSGDVVTLRDTTLTLLGSTGRASGALVLGDKPRFDFSSFALQSGEASRLLAAATGRAQAGIGGFSAAGALKGDVQRATFNGSLTAMGTSMTGHVEAALGGRPNIAVNLRVPGTLDFDHWLGVGPGPAGGARTATGKPIDLSALRSFDATVTLETSAVAVASVQVNYADLQASLRNGVFNIAKLTGQFYGGAVDFRGTIDANRNTLALDLAGSLQGIYLGEMLRGTAGTNNFGNEHLTVAIDGKVSVMNISLKGSGTSPEQIRNSLSGFGQVSGYLYPAVVKGSLGFASFATGVGSLFSTEMGFNSAVLSAFVNHQNTLSGGLQLANGTVRLQDQAVQGQNAVAKITGTTSLTTAVTDTTIALNTGGRGTADYVMTVKGPVSSPTLTTRGR